jgi:type I restriction enzyme S subunit
MRSCTRIWSRVAAHFDLLLDRPEAVDALERAIGHMAVRGLLVPQDPADPPAKALLAELQAKKAQLIAEGKVKREKDLPVIRDEDAPFALPDGWAWARFPELGEFGRGKSKHRPRNDPTLFSPGVYPLIQTGDVARADRVIERFNAQYSESGLAQSRLWPAGTLCITIAANIADSAILGFDACFPDSVVGFVPVEELVDARYVLTFIETAKDDLTAFAPSTAQKNINLEILNNVLIPVPPRNEMLRIVARVEELRNLCGSLRARLTARQTCQARFAEAVVGQATSTTPLVENTDDLAAAA